MNKKHRPHAAHPSRGQTNVEQAAGSLPRPAEVLDSESPAVREMLEQLDDVVYSAIRGSETSLEKAQLLWPATMAMLGWRLVEESREQYLRYAIDISQQLDEGATRDPKRMVAALDVISLLMREEV